MTDTRSREALIKALRELVSELFTVDGCIVSAAADMLEADSKAQQVLVPDGYVLVPVEPTPAMMAAGFCVSEAEHDPAGVYRAMLAAMKDVNDAN